MVIGTEIAIIFLLFVINGVFAMTEMAMVSARKTRLQQMADDGNGAATEALNLVENPNRILSAVQVGITLVGILSGALGGATVSGVLAGWFAQVPALEPYSQVLAMLIVVTAITYFSLVIGELIPKRLALNNPEKIASFMAKPIRGLAWLARPMIALLSASTDVGLRLLGAKPSGEPPVTDDDIRLMLEQGTEVGIFERSEQDIVESVFRLSDRRVDAIMTPRTEMVWLDIEDPLDVNLRKMAETQHAQFPVSLGDLDNVQGVLRVKELLGAFERGGQVNIGEILHPPVFVPESMPALRVLDQVKEKGLSMALVLDEYGGVAGMVTQVDILESLVGEIPTSDETHHPQVMVREDGSWLMDGLLRIDELKDILDLDELPEEERAGYGTLGGLMMSRLGIIPQPGDHFEWQGYRFEVLDMDGRRVDKVLVARQAVAA